jgi:hypothetical protein
MNELLLEKIKRVQMAALLVGLGGLAACVIGRFIFHQPFFQSYLFAFLFWLDLTLGCLMVAMIHHLTGGRWGFITRRVYEAGFMTLPLMLVLFAPILLGLHELYPWAKPEMLAANETVQHKHLYLTVPFYVIRTFFFFAVWIVMAALLRKWSLGQDAVAEIVFTRRMRALSGPGIVILALTITGASIDWIMSLEPEWYSTIFAVVIMSGQVLVAFALAIVTLALLENFLPASDAATPLHFHQLGNLLLTFVMFWTYVSFSQLLIIWSGNLPHEISWYLHRIAGNWKWLIAAVALFHFFLPFLLLLFRSTKKQPLVLVSIAVALLFVHLTYVYWLVAPSIYTKDFKMGWLDVAAPIGLGGFWIATFLHALKRHPLLPRNDPRIKEKEAHAG